MRDGVSLRLNRFKHAYAGCLPTRALSAGTDQTFKTALHTCERENCLSIGRRQDPIGRDEIMHARLQHVSKGPRTMDSFFSLVV